MRIAAPVLGPIWLIEARVLLAGLALFPFIIPRGGLQAFRHHARNIFRHPANGAGVWFDFVGDGDCQSLILLIQECSSKE